jgi:hypothetical protein
MQRMKWVLSLFFFSNFVCLNAQIDEIALIHLDRPFYGVGDETWFKIYLLGNEKVSSSIIHAELVSPQGKILIHQNLQATDKMASGNFTIPLDWQEGNYLFRVYTLWQNDSLNAPKAKISKVIIPIYNDLTDTKPQVEKAIPLIEKDETPALIGEYAIKYEEKKVFKRREKITLNLSVTDLQNKPVEAYLSVSVLENTPLRKNDLWAHFQETQTSLNEKPLKQENLTPEKELTLKGKILDTKNPKPLTEKYLSLYLPQSNQFRRLDAKEGIFKTTLPFFEAQSDIQILSLNPNMSFPLDVEKMDGVDLPIYQAEKTPARLPEIEKYLQLNRMRRQTTDIFNLSKLPSLPQDSLIKRMPSEPDNSYDTKNFTNLTTFEDFVNEVMYTSIIFKKENKKTMRLQNADTKKVYNFAPWLLVDGLFVNDEEEVFNIPINEIARIDIFNKKKTIEKYFDVLMFRYGVISITTKKNDHRLPIIQSKKSIVQGFTSTSNWQETPVTDEKVPNFQTLLTWQPYIKTKENGSALLSFRPGDIKGKFAVRIVGMTTSSKPISGVFYIDIN